MARAFKVTPKRAKRSNGGKEVQEAYMRLYGFDYKKACCSQGDFNYKELK